MKNALELNDITMIYQSPTSETLAIEHLGFSVKKGEFVSIVGPSGCGKSTLLSLIAGLETPVTGSVFVEGTCGYMLQKDHLFEWRNVLSNLMLPLEVAHAKADSGYVHNLLEKYGLADFKKSKPSELSGGMRQRCALIRTLALRPDILLLDEPFSALDYQSRLAVSDDIHNIIKSEGKTAVMVTHDISESISMSDRILLISKRPGRIKKEYDLEPLKGLSPMQRRKDPNFSGYFDEIWKELDVHVLYHTQGKIFKEAPPQEVVHLCGEDLVAHIFVCTLGSLRST